MSAEHIPKLRSRGRPRSNTQKAEKPNSSNNQKSEKPNNSNNQKSQKPSNSHLEWYTPHKPKEMDPCDCPYAECEGCWYPCNTCGSTKCSQFCRRIRKSMEMRQAPIEWKSSL